MDLGYTVEQIRAAEAQALRQGSVNTGLDALMQRAAAGLATAVLRTLRDAGLPPAHQGALGGFTVSEEREARHEGLRRKAYARRVLLVVGAGNNGGDALFAGARLARRGVRVSAWRTAATVHEAGWDAFVAAGGQELDAAAALAQLPRQDLVIDGVAGIGSRPGLTGEVAQFAAACGRHAVPVVAVDLPSGLAPEPPFTEAAHFVAALTVSFGGLKACHLMEPARSACGRVELVDIDLNLSEPAYLQWGADDLDRVWPVPDATSDKYSRGVVGLNTGSVAYPGAAVLGVAGAVGAGAGMVRYLGPDPVAQRIIDRFPNVVPGPGRVQALVLGSGWGEHGDPALVAEAIAGELPVVLDADALRFLNTGRPDVVLTPHAGELARLLRVERAEVEADPVSAVRAAVERTGCTVLLKGATQYVATPGDLVVRLAVPGPGWTAQAGSGDVLAGICGALLAAGLSPSDAALAASSVQALTAAAHPGPLPPQDLAARLRVGVR